MDQKKSAQATSELLRTIGQPIRLQILAEIGDEEACGCHLETRLSLRQALISQHLMNLRKAEVLISRGEGRFVNYRLADPRTKEIIAIAARIAAGSEEMTPPEGLPETGRTLIRKNPCRDNSCRDFFHFFRSTGCYGIYSLYTIGMKLAGSNTPGVFVGPGVLVWVGVAEGAGVPDGVGVWVIVGVGVAVGGPGGTMLPHQVPQRSKPPEGSAAYC